MLDGAAGGEGTGNGEEDDFLVGPFCGAVVSLVLVKIGRRSGGRSVERLRNERREGRMGRWKEGKKETDLWQQRS